MKFTLSFFICFLSIQLSAAISLPKIISSNMVIQRNLPFQIYGHSTNEKIVTVTFDGIEKKCEPINGNWSVEFPAQKEGGPFQIKVIGENEIALKNIYFGDVFLFSGGVNMSTNLASVQDSLTIHKDSNYPDIRFLSVGQSLSKSPQNDIPNNKGWGILNAENSEQQSAIAVIISKILYNKLKIPIGIIDNSWEETDIASLLPLNCFQDKPNESNKLEMLNSIPTLNTKHLKDFKFTLDVDVDSLKTHSKAWHNQFPTCKFNAIVAPLVHQKLSGILYFQNDEDIYDAHNYDWKFIRLINEYRNQWKQNDLPFIFAQLPPQIEDSLSDNAQCEIFRKSQNAALLLPYTAPVNTIDLMSPDENHQLDVKSIAQRFIYPIEVLCYNKQLDYNGPSPVSIERNTEGYLITFDHFDKTLMAINGEVIKGFKVPNPGSQLKETTAKIISPNQVQVYSDHPVAGMIRYLWSANPGLVYLYNSLGNPAPPFEWYIE